MHTSSSGLLPSVIQVRDVYVISLTTRCKVLQT
jgi:hypothetical protein